MTSNQMHPLSADQILRIWEIGQRQHPVDQALTLLAFACPEQSAAQLASLTVGQRDAALLTLREMTFGPIFNCFVHCPECAEQLEFTLNVTDVRLADSGQLLNQEYAFVAEGFDIKFRLPNSWDLAAIANCHNPEAGKAILLQRCLLQVHHNGCVISSQELPPQITTQIATQMAQVDPQAEMLLDLCCPACNYEWQILFDIVSFFWAELNNQAKRLLLEVHQLARHYSWREADILSMSAMRRNLYLELIG